MSTTKEPLHTLVVGCLVRNEQDEVLLIRNHKRGWEIPQGRIEEGESLIDALHREVREEAGVEIEMGPLAAVWSKVTLPPAVIFTFLGRYLSGELAGSGDSAEARWLSPAAALEEVSNKVMKERLKILLEFDGTINYRSYTLKPYEVLQERDLGGYAVSHD
ncbi:MAG TPA: NUDIX hydrolase [Desulfuromonadales bacterium]|nr:NUDIX hydrolase [Desulfuromonadales bacterium]